MQPANCWIQGQSCSALARKDGVKCRPPLLQENSSKAHEQCVEMLTPANASKLTAEMFCGRLRIAVIIFIDVLNEPGFDFIANGGPVKRLRKEEYHAHRSGRRIKIPAFSLTLAAPARGAAQEVVNEECNNSKIREPGGKSGAIKK